MTYLSASYLQLEYTGDAKDYLKQLVAIIPENWQAPDGLSTDLYKRLEKARRKIKKKKTGAFEIETTPPGATIRIDGVVRCEITPCKVEGLSRGDHYIQAEHKTAGRGGSVSKVKSGWATPVKLALSELVQSKTNEPVSPVVLKQVNDQVAQGKIDQKLRIIIDQIAQSQQVDYVLITHLLSKGRELYLFSYLYGSSQKTMLKLETRNFKANFSAMKVNAMRLQKQSEEYIKKFPKDKAIDGLDQELINLIKQVEEEKAAAAALALAPIKAPPQVAPPVLKKPTIKDIKPPPVSRYEALEAAKKDTKKKESKGISPWVWGSVGVAVVGGAVASALLIIDAQSQTPTFRSQVVW